MNNDIYIINEPLLTEEGFINEACLNELESALRNMPPTYERLKYNTEWNTPKWIFWRDIIGYFAMCSVSHLDEKSERYYPPGLENMLGYLGACLRRKFSSNKLGMLELSLCDINKMLHDILMEDQTFLSWNTGENWLDLHALLHQVCILIRTERRESARFEARLQK